MSRYRKIDPRIWNDVKFRSLPDKGKLAFLFLLSHPHMTAIGAMRATFAGLAEEIGWTPDAMSDAISHAIRHGMVVANRDASFVALPNFIKYNKPEGPNSVVKAWPAALEMLPECPEKRELAVRCKEFLGTLSKEFFAKSNTSELWDAIEHAISYAIPDAKSDAIKHAIPDAMSEPSAIQEQEQEHEQEKENSGEKGGVGERSSAAPSPSAPAPQKNSPESISKPDVEPQGRQGVIEGVEWQAAMDADDVQDTIRENQTERGTRLPADYVISESWLLQARKVRPDLPEDQIKSAAASFVGHWSSKPGKDGLKLNWFSAWLNWVRKERAWPAGGSPRSGWPAGGSPRPDQPRLLPPSSATAGDPERERKLREFRAKYPGAEFAN